MPVFQYVIGQSSASSAFFFRFLSRNMTQEQLGDKIGVQKSQISRLEKSRNVSLSSMARIFQAMNIPLSLEIGGIRKVALW